jgi:EAL and modified HD-GYP domain-containing signal transduction protein
MLVGVPVEEVLADVDVTEVVRAAILQQEGTAGTILSAVKVYMDADWDRAEGDIARLGADSSALFDVYLDSITWAGDRHGLPPASGLADPRL